MSLDQTLNKAPLIEQRTNPHINEDISMSKPTNYLTWGLIYTLAIADTAIILGSIVYDIYTKFYN